MPPSPASTWAAIPLVHIPVPVGFGVNGFPGVGVAIDEHWASVKPAIGQLPVPGVPVKS